MYLLLYQKDLTFNTMYRVHHDHDHMVVGFITTHAIGAYHH